MARVLVTGASGFIGSYVSEHFLNLGHEVWGFVSLRHRGKVPNIHADLKVKVHDLTAPVPEDIIPKPDIILNLAAESHVDRSIQAPTPFIKNNIDIALNMVDYARRVRPSIYLQFGTDEEYGPAPKGYASKEWDPALPSNPYAASKVGQSAVTIASWRTDGLNAILTQTMNVYDSHLDSRQDLEKFVPMVTNKIFRGETVPIHAVNGEVGSRHWIHAEDVAKALEIIVKNRPVAYPESDRPDRYNISGEELTNLEMAEIIAKKMDKPLKYKLVDAHSSRPGHDLRYALDGTKLRKLGFKPRGVADAL